MSDELDDIDDILDRLEADFDRRDAVRRELLDRFNRRLPDVPLHQRGFGVMDEPPA